jgi:hypothetical protein
LVAEVRRVVEDGDHRQEKALLQAHVKEIRVVGRNESYPELLRASGCTTAGFSGASRTRTGDLLSLRPKDQALLAPDPMDDVETAPRLRSPRRGDP